MKIKRIYHIACCLLLSSNVAYLAAREEISEKGTETAPIVEDNQKKMVAIGGGGILAMVIMYIIYQKMKSNPRNGLALIDKDATMTMLETLKMLNKGEVLTGENFQGHAKEILDKVQKNQLSVDTIMPHLKTQLCDNEINITKADTESDFSKRNKIKKWANQIENGFIDSGALTSRESATMLDALLTLHTELAGDKATKEMLNEGLQTRDFEGSTVLHNLINRHGSENPPETSKGSSLNCLPHINVVLKHGADPTLESAIHENGNKEWVKKSAIYQAEEKNILIKKKGNEGWEAEFSKKN